MQHNIKTAIRHNLKSKINLALNSISLVLGFLVCSAIMLNAWQQVRTDHFIKNSQRIFRLNCGGYGVTPLCFKGLIGSTIPEIEESARLSAGELNISLNNEPAKIDRICYIDESFIRMFGIKLIEGDAKTALADPLSLILTESQAVRIFGNSQVIGKTLKQAGKYIFTITGVMQDLPRNSHLIINGLTSIQNLPLVSERSENLEDCGSWNQLTYLLIRDPNQMFECEKKLNVCLEDHKMGTRDGKIPLRLEPLLSIYFDAAGNKFDGSQHGNPLILISFTVLGILTLIIALINCVNYSLSQTMQRSKELLVMRIFGASKAQVSVKIIVEMALLFIFSAILSILILELLLKDFTGIIGFEMGFPSQRLYFYLILLTASAVLGSIAGLFPAIFHNSRSIFFNDKKPGFRNQGQNKGRILILIQYTLAIVFMSTAFIVFHHIDFMLKKERGFRPENVLQIELDEQLGKNSEYLKKRILQEDGTEKLAFSNSWIPDGFGKSPFGERGKEILCNFFSVDPDYFELLGIKMSSGRNYSWTNPSDTSSSIIFTETTARLLETSSDIGHVFDKNILIGITNDFNFLSFKNSVEPCIIRCLKEKPRVMSIRLSQANQKKTKDKIIGICGEISPGFHSRAELVTESLNKMYSAELKLSRGISFYSAIALMLSILGILGITIIRLRRRRKEIAIRRINGATTVYLNKFILRDYIPWVLLANILSLPFTMFLAKKWLQSYAFHESISPMIFIITCLITLVITTVIIVLITTMSCRANPAEVLREE